MKTNFEVGQDRELSDRRNVLLREVTRHLLLDLEITFYVSSCFSKVAYSVLKTSYPRVAGI